jgi:hypothetical protein
MSPNLRIVPRRAATTAASPNRLSLGEQWRARVRARMNEDALGN